MDLMADGPWNWCIAGRIEPGSVTAALAGALDRPVHGMVPGEDLMCDVYHVGGDFPTVVDIYLTPAGVVEETIASAVAVRLRSAVLLPDDTLNPTRYVVAEPDGTLRAVHVDERETDDGTERRHLRPCTGSDPACALPAGCGRSRWKPDPTPERPAAA
ncbi:hypothetical protein SAMN04489716_8168 [Actinoplanes derwentensis]|uniref:Uncharacterized protein n=2 Tax=Actinoplanes derwentensis TaxID=113562 RepID=A0A1H2D5B4_9ACTN|nr:hypothetical protein Ade03nite_42390 [Actinoplanes derwentensis]SDT77948.1 hypothetical protein SAMN04489716_8168 [Actinoplanes derwentensis]